ncbi:MAG TPA: alpha/beta fold hydrolase [Streptosporangiaceae bacterium]|jgi:pimeloyl-ACP methyl ester carboxylesterase
MVGELQLMQASDGRQLEVLTAGPPGGRVLVMHNGTPSGPVAQRPAVEAAAARGLRTVICARPGYSRSDPLPGRRAADVVPDTAAVLDALGAGEFVTVGWSGGGPHALACAAGLPGRCLAAASMAGVAPSRAPGLDWLAGMGAENVAEFGAALAGPAELDRYLAAETAGLADIQADGVAADLAGLASAADKAVITGEFAEYLAASFRAALSNGLAGWRDDDLAFASDWGFTVAEVGAGAPVAIWQGDQDLMVPFAHGEWLAAHVPGARSHLLPGEGHLTLAVNAFGQVLDDLLDLAGWPTA